MGKYVLSPRISLFQIPACYNAIVVVSHREQYNLSLYANNVEYQYLEFTAFRTRVRLNRFQFYANYHGINNNGTAKLWRRRFMINLAIVRQCRGRKVLTSFCRNLSPADISRAMHPEVHERIEIVSSIVHHVPEIC